MTVLGTGAIGTAVARALLAAGLDVTAWNRSAAKTVDAAGAGAAVGRSLAEAAAASPLVLLCLNDYSAVTEVLSRAGTSLSGRVVAVLTTGSPGEAADAARLAGDLGADYLDGGVQTTPENLGRPAAVLLFSGSRSAHEAHRPTLAHLGTATYLGEDPTAAAVYDLALFGLWYDAQIGYLRALQTVAAAGVEPETFAPAAAVQLQHVVSATADTAHEIRTGSFPRGPADLHEHAPVLTRLAAMRRHLELGLGGGDLDTVIALIDDRIARNQGHHGLNHLFT